MVTHTPISSSTQKGDPKSMTAKPRLYPRGFLLTPTSRGLPQAVSAPHSYPIKGYTLHAEELTEVDLAESGDTWVAVIGKAWPLSVGTIPANTPSVADCILRMAFAADWLDLIEEALYDLGGRYAILVHRDDNVTVYNDACGNRSVFYSSATREVSSHFTLIRRGLTDQALRPTVGNDHREDLSWERTRSPHIGALLPNHRLNLHGDTQDRFFPNRRNRALSISSDDRLSTATSLWAEQLKRIVEHPAPKVMSITAGLDSRMMLALAQDHLTSFRTFTYTSDEAINQVAASTYWSQSGVNDFTGVQQLKPFLSDDHLIIGVPADKSSDSAQAWIAEHANTLNHNAERSHNRRLLPRYIDNFPDPQTIHYRGNLLEIGRLHLRKPEGSRQAAFDVLIKQLASAANLDEVETMRDANDSTARLGYLDIAADYDLTDIFYWEQRHGRWFAQVLNETDAAFDTVTPFNVRRIIDLFLAYAIKDRAAGFAQQELIYRGAPLLTFVGVNGAPDLYRRYVSQGLPEHQ